MSSSTQNPIDEGSVRRERIEAFLDQLAALPPLPGVTLRLLHEAERDDCSTGDLAGLIEQDPSTAAALLKLANEANLGVLDESMTVVRAVTQLGIVRVRNAILALHFWNGLRPPQACAEVFAQVWRHSIAVASAAELLAEQHCGDLGTGNPYLCGLLHDIGKIALMTVAPKGYHRVAGLIADGALETCDAERHLLSIDHMAAGRRVLSRWGAPSPVVDCAWLHHLVPRSLPESFGGSRSMIGLVQVANALVHRLGIGCVRVGLRSTLDSVAGENGFTIEEIEKAEKRLPDRMASVLSMIGLAAPEAATLHGEVLLRANRSLGRINAELAEAREASTQAESAITMIAAFMACSRSCSGLSDVCAAAASTLRDVLPAPRVVVFAYPSPSASFLMLACADASGVRTKVQESCWVHDMCQEVSETREAAPAEIHPRRTGVSPTAMGREEIQFLWSTLFEESPHDPLDQMPLTEDGRVVGGVLWEAATASGCAKRRSHVLVSQLIARDVVAAIRLTGAQRLQEELVETHRKLDVSQHERIRHRTISMIAEMAAGAAHEINNPLAVISGRAQMEASRSTDEASKRSLLMIVEQAGRASAIITELMDFAKPRSPQPALLPLRRLLDAACRRWQERSGLTPAQIFVCGDPGAQDPGAQEVFVDPTQVDQILDELIANALQASGDAPRVEVNSSTPSTDDKIRIVVSDQGTGMSPHVLERASDPFFSDRPAGRGRGLGLSRAMRLTQINGGRLWIESQPNLGTRVSLELPSRPSAG